MTTNKLDEWFKNLFRQFPGAEIIEDVLAETPLAMKPRNADYFFDNRRFIGELKSLLTSRMPRVQAVLDQLRDEGELPVFYHEAPVWKVIDDHPDRRNLNRQFLMQLAKGLAKDFADANSQIQQTKAAFDLPLSLGFILITNFELPEMTPQLAWNKLNRLIIKKRGNTFAYEHIDFAIFIQDVEVKELNKNHALHPCLVVMRKDDAEIANFSNRLLKTISTAMGTDFLEFNGDANRFLESTTPHRRFSIETGQLTRSGLWRKRYTETRTHRQLTDEQLLRELARFIIEEYLCVRNGKIGPNITASNRDYLGETLEGLVTECELRFLDMRKVKQQFETLLDQGLVKGAVADFLIQRSAESG